MADLFKYRVYCETDSVYETIWAETEPTTCPVNTSHSITSSATSIIDTILSVPLSDSDGAPMSRLKMFKTSVSVRFHFIDLILSKIGGLYHKKLNGDDMEWCTYKIYDASDVEITSALDELNAVKTVVDWEPPSINYEIIGGAFYQNSVPSDDIYVWTIGVPDVSEAYGGSIAFATSANLKNMGSGLAFVIDGRVPKQMTYSASTHSSKLRFVFKHSAGDQHKASLRIDTAY